MTAAILRPFRLAPDSGWLVAAAALAAALLTALPLLLLGTAARVLLVAAAIVAAAAVLFSTRRTLAAALLVMAALPGELVAGARLPLGLRPWEVLLLAAILFAAVDLVYFERLRLRRSSADGLMAAFLAVALLSGGIGVYYGNEAILRNLRYPLYYAAFFLVLQAVELTDLKRLFAPVLAALGVLVTAQYLLEFLGAIDLSTGDRFVRIGHRQGVVLPVVMLMLANQYVHDPRRWGRTLLLALFLLNGLGLALTLGRGMWAAFALGLLVTVWLWHVGQPASRRRPWKGIALVVGMVALLAASVLAFQRVTGAAISVHAVERSRSFVDIGRDVQVLSRILNYASAWEQIARHPVLGTGQGAVVTSFSFNPRTEQFEKWKAWTLDSLYLTLWLKMGLAGLALFPWLCAHVARCGYRAFRASDDPAIRAFCSGAVAVLAAMAVLGISDGSMVNGRFAALFAVLMGLVMVAHNQTVAGGREEGRGAG